MECQEKINRNEIVFWEDHYEKEGIIYNAVVSQKINKMGKEVAEEIVSYLLKK